MRGAKRRDKDPGHLLMLKVGELVHEYIAGMIGDAVEPYGWDVTGVEKHVELTEGSVTIGGSLDIELTRRSDGYVLIVDVKTKRGNAFKYLDEPKPGNEIQVQSYVAANDADAGGLLYTDREGQNFMRWFPVARDDSRPRKAIRMLDQIRNSDEPPDPVGLTVVRKELKGPDSVYLNESWHIGWCDLEECLCAKALPARAPKGVVAKLHEKKDKPTEIRLTAAGSRFGTHILELLDDKYPDEEFVLIKKE